MHQLDLRVYYEDTDLAGIVYYANYLKFIERGRTEWLRAKGVNQMALKNETGIVFAVRRLYAEYLKPAHMDDALVVQTQISRLGGASIEFDQRVLRGSDLLFSAEVIVAALSENGRPSRISNSLREALAK